jgi:lipopolysaccharide transport system ATP-binding protein
MENESVIQLKDVFKKYRLGQMGYRTLRDDIISCFKRAEKKEDYFCALNGVSFDLKRGESIGIIGDNGAGKSTILKILAGVTRQSSGTVEKKGKIGALIELSAGFHPELTGRENIYLYGAIIGLKRNYINKRFDEIVEFSGLSQFLDTPIKKYSSGMHARLGFSVTAHLDPDILLIDEVLSVGDFLFQNKCFDKMLEYKRKNVSIIFVSHNLDAVRKICDRAILFKKGQVIHDGDVEQAINEYYFCCSERQKRTRCSLQMIDLLDKKMLDSMGRSCTIVNSGEKVRFELTLKAGIELKDICFAIFIRHSNGMVVFDTSSNLLNRRSYTYARNQKILLKYEMSINLLKGNYIVGSNIFAQFNNGCPEYIFYENNLFAFTVKDSISHQGIANLFATCSVEQI